MSEHEPGQVEFDRLMAEVTASPGRFGHREHLNLTWLAVRQYGMPGAISFVSEGIKTTARYANAPQKYHATISRAWVELVYKHEHERVSDDFDEFIARNPALLDKGLLMHFYTSATLASSRARTEWVEPDVAPLP